MPTHADTEGQITALVAAWARRIGVTTDLPVRAATERAAAAHEAGATLPEACGLARSLLTSWLRHPANTARTPDRNVA
jgi:hypothetical protein